MKLLSVLALVVYVSYAANFQEISDLRIVGTDHVPTLRHPRLRLVAEESKTDLRFTVKVENYTSKPVKVAPLITRSLDFVCIIVSDGYPPVEYHPCRRIASLTRNLQEDELVLLHPGSTVSATFAVKMPRLRKNDRLLAKAFVEDYVNHGDIPEELSMESEYVLVKRQG